MTQTAFLAMSDPVALAIVTGVFAVISSIVGIFNTYVSYLVKKQGDRAVETVQEVKQALDVSTTVRDEKLNRIIDTSENTYALTNGGMAAVLEEKKRIADRLAEVAPTPENVETAERVRRKLEAHRAKMRDAMYVRNSKDPVPMKASHMTDNRDQMEQQERDRQGDQPGQGSGAQPQ